MSFSILTDSTCDLSGQIRSEYDIDYAPMRFSVEGEDYIADIDYKTLSPHDFYEIMRGGKRVLTAQVPSVEFENKFTQNAKNGVDTLYIACSSELSASVNQAVKIAQEVMAKYPERKIICVDSLVSGAGEGILCIIASQLRAQGKSISEVAQFIEENKLKANQEGTVDKLTYLRQAGRISGASAFFGGILSVKPIIVSDKKGRNIAIEKVQGRKKSLDKIIERTVAQYQSNPYYEDIFVMHADCLPDAKILRDKLVNAIPIAKEKIHIGFIGPIVGASVGPGTVAIYFFGKEVEFSAD